MSSETGVQGRVAHLLEEQRYSRPCSLEYHRWWVRQMVSMLPSRGAVLDAGCGTGILLQAVPSLKPRVVGMDLSWEMLIRARKRTDRLIRASAQQLPFQDGAFDSIFARSLFHHLRNLEDGLEEAARVLKPGGTLVLADTNRSLLSVLPRLLLRRSESFSESHKNLAYGAFRKKIERLFEVREVVFFGYLAYLLIAFPDLWDPLRLFPFKKKLSQLLMKLDEALISIPIIRRLAFGVMICAIKR